MVGLLNPSWWEERYGVAPTLQATKFYGTTLKTVRYTSTTEYTEVGIYKRDKIYTYIPVNEYGELLPIDSISVNSEDLSPVPIGYTVTKVPWNTLGRVKFLSIRCSNVVKFIKASRVPNPTV